MGVAPELLSERAAECTASTLAGFSKSENENRSLPTGTRTAQLILEGCTQLRRILTLRQECRCSALSGTGGKKKPLAAYTRLGGPGQHDDFLYFFRGSCLHSRVSRHSVSSRPISACQKHFRHFVLLGLKFCCNNGI